jgi:hypothetical protein
MDSILISIKKLLGIAEDYTDFDMDIIMCINTAFSILNQIGVGPEKAFMIQDELAVWDDFIPEDIRPEMLKTYIHQKVRLLFDPPTASSLLEATNKSVAELEWRLYVASDRSDN